MFLHPIIKASQSTTDSHQHHLKDREPNYQTNIKTMKSFAAALALASAVTASSLLARQDNGCIRDTVATPSTADIQNSIEQWNTDVVAVNDFLNSALGLDSQTLGTKATAALANAKDEPCQLQTLANDANFDGFATDAFTCAVGDLQVVFGDHVITNLNTIISDPTNTAAVHAAVQDINFFRCCNVLPDADILWTDAAEEATLFGQVPTTAQRPDACSSIDCSGVTGCITKDNGSF